MNATSAQLPVRPRRHAAHVPQEIWKGTLTSWPGEGRAARDDQRIEVARRDCLRADERGEIGAEPRRRRFTPLENVRAGVDELLHAALLSCM
jgi:hypothetical protein